MWGSDCCLHGSCPAGELGTTLGVAGGVPVSHSPPSSLLPLFLRYDDCVVLPTSICRYSPLFIFSFFSPLYVLFFSPSSFLLSFVPLLLLFACFLFILPLLFLLPPLLPPLFHFLLSFFLITLLSSLCPLLFSSLFLLLFFFLHPPLISPLLPFLLAFLFSLLEFSSSSMVFWFRHGFLQLCLREHPCLECCYRLKIL